MKIRKVQNLDFKSLTEIYSLIFMLGEEYIILFVISFAFHYRFELSAYFLLLT
jgi:hypothetical protein